ETCFQRLVQPSWPAYSSTFPVGRVPLACGSFPPSENRVQYPHLSTYMRGFCHDISSLFLAVYLYSADKYHRLTRRPSKGQKGPDETALMASQWPSPRW